MKEELQHIHHNLIIERVVTEAEESPLLTESDREYLATLSAPSRRAQWSTARTILRRELGEKAELRYTSSGALVLAKPIGDICSISVSHTSEWVAVLLSGSRCGVDIELLDRNFSKVASRYISHEERERLSEKVGEQFEALMWSAKEAIYKYGAHEGFDFLRDLVVTDIDTTSSTLYAELYGLPAPPLHYQLHEDHICCYIVG